MYKLVVEPKPKLQLPVHAATTFVLVRPHYPENVGAIARAIKTMGFTRLCLVKPGKIAIPSHEMAQKMAVKSRDVLNGASILEQLDEVLQSVDCVVATTSRSGIRGATGPRKLAPELNRRIQAGQSVAVLFGNEKTGLSAEVVDAADYRLRVPMAGDQPSVNLAQAAQLVAYELFLAALELRESSGESTADPILL